MFILIGLSVSSSCSKHYLLPGSLSLHLQKLLQHSLFYGSIVLMNGQFALHTDERAALNGQINWLYLAGGKNSARIIVDYCVF